MAYGAFGDGLHDDYAAIMAAFDSGHCVFFPISTYTFATPIVRTDSICAIGEGRASTLKYIGAPAQYAIRLDYGTAQNGQAARLEYLMIDGNGRATNGLHTVLLDGCTLRNVEVRNVSGVAVLGEAMTSVLLDTLIISSNVEPFSAVPVEGLRLTSIANGTRAGLSGGAVTVLNPKIEGVSGPGIDFDSQITSNVTGGTSEGNGTGILCSVGCEYNTFTSVDLEANRDQDISIAGSQNTWIGITAASPSGAVLNQYARGNVFYGGRIQSISVTSQDARANQFHGVATSSIPADNGTLTRWSDMFDYATSVYFPDKR
jgi:hypothetical protein